MSKEKEITIASYNIASGGFEKYSYDLEVPTRLEQINKAVKIINADFISLIDTFRWEEKFTNEQLIRMFNYRFAHSVNLQDERLIGIGHNNGITILTNLNVIESKPIFIHTRNCIRTVVEVENKKLQIFSTYLDDKSEETRLKQTEELLKHVDPDLPTTILGDLNTTDPKNSADTKKGMDRFLDEYPYLKDSVSATFEDMSRGEVVTRLNKAGFMPANDNYEPTVPTPLFMKLGYKSPLVQLDHVFVKGSLEIKNFEVLQGEVFDNASDHYPVRAKITL